MVIIVAFGKFPTENLAEVKNTFASILPATHKQPGCLLYSVNFNDDTFVVIEKWRDTAAIEQHWNSDHFHKLSQTFETLLTGKPEIYTLEELNAGDPAKNIFAKDPA